MPAPSLVARVSPIRPGRDEASLEPAPGTWGPLPRTAPGPAVIGPGGFVHPDLVVGTLVEGYRFYEVLPPGLARAIFIMFLIAEIHPFTDGNRRVARVLMNAELTAAGLQRIVIPLPYRNNYLQGLRALSNGARPEALLRVLDWAQEYASQITWGHLRVAEAALTSTNAFVPQDEAEELGLRLRLPPSRRD